MNLGGLPKEKKTVVISLIVGLVILVLAVIGLIPVAVGIVNDRHTSQIVNELAQQQAASLNQQLQKLQSTLSTQIQSFGLTDVLLQGDPANFQAQIEKLKTDSADLKIQNARIIPKGSNLSSIGLRFSQIDRLHQAEQGKPVYPEAYEDNGQNLFDLMIPVKDGANNLLGYALLVFNEHVLRVILEQVNPETGETVLEQRFGSGRPRAALRNGSGTLFEKASLEAETVVPHWKIVVVPGQKLLGSPLIAPALMFAVQGVLISCCLFGLLLVSRYAAAQNKKLEETHVTPIQIKGARKIDKADIAATPTEVNEIEDEFADTIFQTGDVFDLDFDDDALEVRAAASKSEPTIRTVAVKERFTAPEAVFRDYDIRGHADMDLSDELAIRIGRAFGTECINQGQDTVVLAGDGRNSTPRLKSAVQEGLVAAGCHVIDIGNVPTPLMNFAVSTLPDVRSGIMVTASHNPATDNGFKMVIDGYSLASEQIRRIKERVQEGDFNEGVGDYRQLDIVDEYIENIVSDIVLAGNYKVVVDCGNGIASIVGPRLLEELGCDVVPLYCNVDGNFPNHAPDPSVMDNLRDLVEKVKSDGADLGVAFDGDGDRLAVVTSSGDIVLPDRLLMLFAKDVVSRNPGTDIIFDVKCTRRLNALISSYGGRPVMWKSGHSHIKNKMIETGAMLGGELSGHIFFKERWFGFDDGMYSAARLLEIMSIRDENLDDIFSGFPDCASTPEIRIPVSEESKFSIIKALSERGEWGNGKLILIDGVRVDFAKGWGLVRASNTSAALTLRFEADDEETLATVQSVFKQQLQAVSADLSIPF